MTTLHDPLLQEQLKTHIQYLAAKVGARPAASRTEEAGFTYIREQLADYGIQDRRTLRYDTPLHLTPSLWLPLLAAAASNIPPAPFVKANETNIGLIFLRRVVRLAGALVAIAAGRAVWDALRYDRTRIRGRLGSSSTQVGVIPAKGDVRGQVVLIAHVDTPQTLQAFQPPFRAFYRLLGSALLAAPVLNGLGQVGAALFGDGFGRGLRRISAVGTLGAALVALFDTSKPHIAGANDNATGVAVLLEAARQLAENPLEHTTVWIAFTGAGAAGGRGLHALLDSYGDQLRGAHFVNVERVGSFRLSLAEKYAGYTHFTPYTPDPYTLALADRVRAVNPVLGIEKRPAAGADEVAVLRLRGYNGITLSGYDPEDELPAGWFKRGDVPGGLHIDGVERAFRFVEAFVKAVDARLV